MKSLWGWTWIWILCPNSMHTKLVYIHVVLRYILTNKQIYVQKKYQIHNSSKVIIGIFPGCHLHHMYWSWDFIFDHLFLQVVKAKEEELAFISFNFIAGIPRFSPQMVCIMCFQMCPQIPCIRGCKATLVTPVWLFSTMGFQKFPHWTWIRECIITLATFVCLFSAMHF